MFDYGRKYVSGSGSHGSKKGQAMVETCVVIILICLLFFGLFQIVQAYAFREILDHAAMRAARARTVGYNDWMVRKCYRVATIPNAGRMLMPEVDTVDPALRNALLNMDYDALWDFAFSSSPSSPQVAFEHDLIPDYLGSMNYFIGREILDYEFWGTDDDTWNNRKIGMYYAGVPNNVAVRMRQQIPLLIPYADLESGHLSGSDPGTIRLVGRANVEKHYSLYLEE